MKNKVKCGNSSAQLKTKRFSCHKFYKKIQARLKPKIISLANEPRPHGYLKLQGFENRYRIRVGDYRVIYEIYDDVLQVLIVKVGPRRDIY